MGRSIGLDVHRDFIEVAIWDAGKIRRGPRIETHPDAIRMLAESLLSLFQTKLILPDVCDPKTLEAVSLVLGEYGRRLVSSTAGVRRSESGLFSLVTTAQSETVALSMTRQRTLSPGEVAAIALDHALLVRGASWDCCERRRISGRRR
jgi:hypothetical protein